MSLRLLAQLCFNEEIAEQVTTDSDLCNYLQDLIQQNRNKDLKRVSQIILWSINTDSKDPNKNKRVYLSSSPSSRSFCEKIKIELEKHDILVWMDTIRNATCGSNISRATRAIDKSRCVLFCICDKYRLSEKCQAEARYALKLNKHIIPLVLQEGFDNPDGWLAGIVKDKFKVNFANRDFQESIANLLDQISRPTLILGKNVDEWTSSHVSQWFIETRINAEIAKIYKELDGSTLRQIYLLKAKSPEFFYQSMSKETNFKITTSDIAYFNVKLNKLFNQNHED